ncbi:TIGR02530 family flagellar biosynthesis protein [Oscillibacter sp.]|uniref:TIGR02530 family flagellar biosynthesis protein n=1 Tax=Oscillibacter sp. TaxID=1945593 RepID=UPI0028A03AB1|nr:TIGR02530 family flagellar biosynthesis protein [Oscillibacter sp.]
MIDRISPLQNGGFSAKTSAAKAEQTSFGAELLQRQRESQPVAFSKHARERAEQRGISVDEQLMDRLSDTVEKAQAKGANNILAFDTTRAFIINVPNGRVITAMSPEEMKENIFTNIDGAVIL